MATLSDKNFVVVGASRGVGRVIVEAARAQGADVLAAARGAEALADLAGAAPGVRTLAIDATEADAPARVFAALNPDVLVVCGGARPPGAPLHELDWETFSVNWHSDVKASFLFCKAALTTPLAPGSTVVLISSGAALGGSPVSGGYAGAKRTQLFIANYAQKESDRLGLGLRFVALAPTGIMAGTELGQAAVASYARYLGIPAAEFVKGMTRAPTPQDVADAVIGFAADPHGWTGSSFGVSNQGVEAVA